MPTLHARPAQQSVGALHVLPLVRQHLPLLHEPSQQSTLDTHEPWGGTQAHFPPSQLRPLQQSALVEQA